MRIERRGEVAPLTPRIVQFLIEFLGGKSLDSKEASEQLRPDYICLGGRLAVEIKTLEEDGTARLDNFADGLRLRKDWPEMMGYAPLHSVLKNMEDSEVLHKQAMERIGRALVAHVRKANKQLRSYAESVGRKNLVKLLILINEDHEVYEPRIAAYTLQKALARQENGTAVYADIDSVLYLTERHALIKNKMLTLPIMCVEGMQMAPWKRDVVDLVVNRWNSWNGKTAIVSDASVEDFTTIEHVPRQMRRQEKWELDYRRKPYMSHYSDEQLRDVFDEVCLSNLITILKDSPIKPSKERMALDLERQSHLMVEMGKRGIPITKFKFEPTRVMAAANRMRLATDIINWLSQKFSIHLSSEVATNYQN